MLFVIKIATVQERGVDCETLAEAANYAAGMADRLGGKVLAVYDPTVWSPPEDAPDPFLPKPPTGPTPGTPTINAPEQTEAFTKVA
jgi:hypothetical protein